MSLRAKNGAIDAADEVLYKDCSRLVLIALLYCGIEHAIMENAVGKKRGNKNSADLENHDPPDRIAERA